MQSSLHLFCSCQSTGRLFRVGRIDWWVCRLDCNEKPLAGLETMDYIPFLFFPQMATSFRMTKPHGRFPHFTVHGFFFFWLLRVISRNLEFDVLCFFFPWNSEALISAVLPKSGSRPTPRYEKTVNTIRVISLFFFRGPIFLAFSGWEFFLFLRAYALRWPRDALSPGARLGLCTITEFFVFAGDNSRSEPTPLCLPCC